MQLISKFNKRFKFLLCVIVIYNKYAWVVPLKVKKRIAVTNAFQKILDESNRREPKSKGYQPNKIWVDEGSEFDNRSIRSWLENNNRDMYSTHNSTNLF